MYIVVIVQLQQFPKPIDRYNKFVMCWFIEAKIYISQETF